MEFLSCPCSCSLQTRKDGSSLGECKEFNVLNYNFTSIHKFMRNMKQTVTTACRHLSVMVRRALRYISDLIERGHELVVLTIMGVFFTEKK